LSVQRSSGCVLIHGKELRELIERRSAIDPGIRVVYLHDLSISTTTIARGNAKYY
jgi:hypothetical protein